MNIVEQEALKFYRRLYRNGKVNDVENLTNFVESKLYSFKRDRDKLDFLKILRQKSVEDLEEHMKTCTGCPIEKDKKSGIFVLDQEIDLINESFTYNPDKEDQFSTQEESDVHNKLNDIIDRLNKQGLGQQIIFNEIEELKYHFNLGKKNWFQLFKGKLVDLSLEKVLDETVIKELYNYVAENFDQAIKLLNS